MQLTTDEQRAALTARNAEVDYGAELLNLQDQHVRDLSPDLLDAAVSHNNSEAVHGAATIDLLTELQWDAVRVRLWQSVNGHRFDVGTYVLTTPEQPLGEDPATYSVQAYDKLTLLKHRLGDTYTVPAGANVLDAVRQAITDAGVTGLPPLFAGEAQDKALTAPMVWLLDPGEPVTWLRVVNDMLRKIGYRGLWVDPSGRFRSEPHQPLTQRPPEWTFDLTDPRTNIVNPDRLHKLEVFADFNWWRFVQEDYPTRPTEGAGQYTVDRVPRDPDTGLPLTAVRPKVAALSAVDQATLVARGDRVVVEDTLSTRTLQIECGPLPVLGHMDVATYADPELGRLKVAVQRWSYQLSGSDVELDLEVVGGG